MSQKICRICLLNSEKTLLTSIFRNTHFYNLDKKLQKCLPFRISIVDGYPKYICYKCLSQLDVVYKFLNNAIQSNAYLQKTKEAEITGNMLKKTQNRKYSHNATHSNNLTMPCIEDELEDDDLIVNKNKRKVSQTTQQRSVLIKCTRQDKCWVTSRNPSASPSVSPENSLIKQEEIKEMSDNTPESDISQTKSNEYNKQSDATSTNLTLSHSTHIGNSKDNEEHTQVVKPPINESNERVNNTRAFTILPPQAMCPAVPMLPYPPSFMWYQFPSSSYPPGLQVMNADYHPTIPIQPPVNTMPKMEPSITVSEVTRATYPPIKMSPLVEVKRENDETTGNINNSKRVELNRETNFQVNRESSNELNRETVNDHCKETKIKIEMQNKSPRTPKQSSDVSSNSSTPFFGESYSLDVNYCKECKAILSPSTNLFQHLLNQHPSE